MATLNIGTSISALGTSNTWTTALTTYAGELFGTVPYLAGSVSSAASSGWSLGAIASASPPTVAATSIVFTYANTPTSWINGTGSASGPVLVTGTTYRCTVYWTDSNGVQQYATGIPLLLTIVALTSYTWSCGSVTCYAISAALAAQSSSSTTVTNIVICPEVQEWCDLVGDATSGDSLTGLTIASSRTGLVSLIGAVAGGTNGSASGTTFTLGTVDLGAGSAVTTSMSIVVISCTTGTAGVFPVTTGTTTPYATCVCATGGSGETASIGTMTGAIWYALPTALASRTFLTSLVGASAGYAWTGVSTSTSNPLYGLGSTTATRVAGAVLISTADTGSAIAPSICAFHA